MKDFFIVSRFEIMNQVKKKSIIVSTVILALVFFVVTSIPTIMTFFDQKNTESQVDQIAPTMPEFMENAGFAFLDETTEETFIDYFQIKDQQIYKSKEDLLEAVTNKAIPYGFLFQALDEYVIFYQDKPLYASESYSMNEILKTLKTNAMLQAKGLTVEDLATLQNISITNEVAVLGTDRSSNMFFSYFMLFVVYTIVLVYGQTTSTTIAREKDNRTMELLITSTTPTSLILGKVAAAGLVSALQFALVLGAGVLGFMLNRSNYAPMILDFINFNITPSLFLVYASYTLLGYILYLFIYASLGSVVSKVEDAASATTPITFLFVAGYLVASIAMSAPDTLWVKVASWVPFFSLMVMPIRFAISAVPWWEILVSLGLLAVALAFFAYLSIRIYRWGSLNYGNKIGFFHAFRQALKKENS